MFQPKKFTIYRLGDYEATEVIKIYSLLGFEVNNFLKILIKTSNAMEFIESDIQNIEASRTDDPII